MSDNPDPGEPEKTAKSGLKINELRFTHPAGSQAMVEVVRLSELRERDVPVPINKPARRDFHVIKLVTEGRGQHWVDYKAVDVTQGDILYFRPGQTHSFHAESAHKALLVVFRPEAAFDPTALQLIAPDRPILKAQPEDFQTLVDIVMQIDSVTRVDVSFDVHQVGQWLLGSLTCAVSQLAAAQVSSTSELRWFYLELVTGFQKLLASHYTERRTVGWFASSLNTTERTLSRACRETHGRTAKEILDNHVALEAKRLLLASQDSIESTAHALGFSESTNFVKFFRRVTGTTPTQFRSLWTAGL